MNALFKDKCCFSRCHEKSELTIVIGGKGYRMCRQHYMMVIRLLNKLCERLGEGSLHDLKVYEKNGYVTTIRTRKEHSKSSRSMGKTKK
ncbi:MAG: hypothetical protein J7L11_00630 [Thermoprotei archaeon]|nr:hypothetical protein [Thermoprotei archaeon]